MVKIFSQVSTLTWGLRSRIQGAAGHKNGYFLLEVCATPFLSNLMQKAQVRFCQAQP